MSDNRPPFSLTPQEFACVRLAGQRLSNKEIALDLGISVGTVKNHLARAAAKTECSGRLATARRLGILDTVPERHISDLERPRLDLEATGDGPATEKPVRSWPLPAPPPRRHRLAAIVAFFIAGAIIAMVAVLTIWTTIRTASDMSPPNAIRALD